MNLIPTPAGWTYPDPPACSCGETTAMRGWQFCRCAGASGGGHPMWRCRACGEVRVLGCVGRVEVSNAYGGRAGNLRMRGEQGRLRVDSAHGP